MDPRLQTSVIYLCAFQHRQDKQSVSSNHLLNEDIINDVSPLIVLDVALMASRGTKERLTGDEGRYLPREASCCFLKRLPLISVMTPNFGGTAPFISNE
ncbi:hypothetical protein TNIN_288471 [Trichonephila inaurata madagascariensis]|uniref:Uncharacterized protein n=1 Tax=Trichonephila inaurata madagascariensis TaxID=2747483 RepID=A0A8X6WXA5_9ARAC|nr:hypothetical protein TNIN_288471 [Trichonephila inaurata madagascariensis]